MEAWELVEQLRDRIGYHGMVEILDYQSTLDIQDATDDEATITRHEVIRFLQDNVVAIHDPALGDGELCAECTCQPGIAVDFVDFHEDGSTVNACSVCCSLPHKSPLVIPPALHQPPQRGLTSAEKGP